MEFVLISKSRGALCRIQLRWTTWLALCCVLSGIVALTAYLSYIRGADYAADSILNNPDIAQNFWQKEITKQRMLLQNIQTDSESDMRALASRLGELQAHITRLDAVAARMVEAADLDATEFQFEESPAVGGPQPAAEIPHSWASLVFNAEALSEELALREDHLVGLESLILDRQLRETLQPAGRPTREGWLSSGFGYRTHPVTGNREFHRGVDFAGRRGAEIHAVAAGIVTWSGRRWGYGYMVEIKHGDGYVTRYAHNRKNLVKVGERVEKDQVIALLGSSGRTTGPHVHFEVVKDGKVVNPTRFIRKTAKR